MKGNAFHRPAAEPSRGRFRCPDCVNYSTIAAHISRDTSASPAIGSTHAHKLEQEKERGIKHKSSRGAPALAGELQQVSLIGRHRRPPDFFEHFQMPMSKSLNA